MGTFFFGRNSGAGSAAKLAAILGSQACIEFELDGTIIGANNNFLAAMGYELAEIRGRHHSMFCDPEYVASGAYKTFWTDLAKGRAQSAAFRRLGKGGREIWIQASYNPVLDRSGKPVGVIKVASDISAQKQKAADHEGQIAAISRVQG